MEYKHVHTKQIYTNTEESISCNQFNKSVNIRLSKTINIYLCKKVSI